MTGTPRTWPFTALRVLVPLVGALLLIQYLAGLWTNAYAPANGFTSNTAFTSLNLHYTVGFVLGVLVIPLVAVSVFTRQAVWIVLSIVVAAGVWVAGIAGMMFVGATPNPPLDSVLMGIAFLVAFWANLMLATLLMFRQRAARWSRDAVPVAPA